jgi:PKD repeat protein
MRRILIIPVFVLLMVSCQKETVRAAFTVNGNTAGTPVFFEASKSAQSYSWDFGDTYDTHSNTSRSKNVSHTYTFPGTYTVTLKIMRNSAYEEYTRSIYIN